MSYLELGRFLRKRYRNLFPDDSYNWRDIYVTSTDKARTIQSAVANLEAFFNNSSVNVPIHTSPERINTHVARTCNRYNQIRSKLRNTPRMRQLSREYRADLKKMAKFQNSRGGYSIRTMPATMDNVECHLANNVSGLPPEFHGEFLARLRQAENWYRLTQFVDAELSIPLFAP